MNKMKLLFLVCLFGILIHDVHAQFPDFEFYYIEKDADWITSAQQTTLSDIDNDGDLDFTTGNVHTSPSLYWYEYISSDEWIRHVIGSDDGFYGGATALDVNKDGLPDIITSEYLFINKPGDRGIGWDKFYISTGDDCNHDMVKADINQDGKMDIITNSGCEDMDGLAWYEMPDNPTQLWIRHEIGGDKYWAHAAIDPWPVGDLDGDGDMDIVQAENDLRDLAGLGWLENDGKGNFTLHWIVPREKVNDFHSLYVFDYNNNGSLDIMVGNGPLSSHKKIYIYENLTNADQTPTSSDWKEHVILGGYVSHDTVVGDVDGDGDMDIVSKEWTSGLVYYLENKLIDIDNK